MLVSEERRKPENPEENPRSKDKNQQQTQPTFDAGSENRTRATLVAGRRVLSALLTHIKLSPPQTLFHDHEAWD